MTEHDDELMARIHRDLLDSFDEELEMEREDSTADELSAGRVTHEHREQRRHYFR